jgi:hypothetical protein
MVSPPHFDHEKLDVYQLELKFLSWVTQFLAEVSSRSLAPTRELSLDFSQIFDFVRSPAVAAAWEAACRGESFRG